MQWMELILKTQPEDLNRLCSLLDELYRLSDSVIRAQEKKGFLKRETE